MSTNVTPTHVVPDAATAPSPAVRAPSVVLIQTDALDGDGGAGSLEGLLGLVRGLLVGLLEAGFVAPSTRSLAS